MTSPPSDIDPLDAITVADLARCLRAVRLRAGNPSYRTLQRWGERHGVPLPRSTVQDALAGRRLPRKALVLGLVHACGVSERDRRWELAWTRLAAHTTATEPARTPLQRSLTHDFAAAGLLRIGARYLNDLDWKRLFADVTELDIVVAYGQTWRNLHARDLATVAARPTSRIRVFLADPDDDLTVAILANRFDVTPDELCSRIAATRDAYNAIRRLDGAEIQIYYRPGDRVFSCYRFDDIAVVGLFSHSRVRGAAVPVFVCAHPGDLYEFIHDELTTILDQSRLT